MNTKQSVKLLAEGLAIGESTEYVTCPFCQAEHEEKFSVTRTDTGLLYGCFRASCGASGFVGTGHWEAEYGEKPVRPKRRPYTGVLNPLTQEDKTFFLETWGIHPEFFKVTSKGEYAFPIMKPNGFRKGWVVRQPRWKGVEGCPRKGQDNPDYPKALTYKDEPDHSRLSWGQTETTSQIVIVEDILSAWKITQATGGLAVGVALNGADMGYQEVKEIGHVRPLSVLIWLDPDATNAAYKMQAKWGLSFNHCVVVTSDRDPKDMSAYEINSIVDDNAL